MMKKNLAFVVMTVLLVFMVIPSAVVFAQGDPASPGDEITGLLNGMGQGVVSSVDELNALMAEIPSREETEITITLAADIDNTTAPFVGVDGKHITVNSTGENHFAIYVGDLEGDCTFDNISITNDREVHANGYKAIFTENVKMTLQALYGGAKDKNVAQTYVVVRGGKIGNKDFSLVGGSELASVEGDVYLEVGGTAIIMHNMTGGNSTYRGGSENRYIGGNVTVVYDRPTTVEEIETGTMGDILNISGTYESEIKGDLTIQVKSGYVKGIEAQRGSYQKTKIGGDVHIIAGDESYANTDTKLRLVSNWGIYGAGEQVHWETDEQHTVAGNIRVDTYENLWGWGDDAMNSTDYPPRIEGAYCATVGGDVTINAHGSHMRYIAALKYATAQNVTINARDIDLDDHEYTSGNQPLDPRNGGNIQALIGGTSAVSGNAVINVEGGSLGQIYTGVGTVAGNAIVNVTGQPQIRMGIYGYNSTASDEKSVLTFDQAMASVPTIGYFTQTNVRGDSAITLGNETKNAFGSGIYDVNINEDASLITNRQAWAKGALWMDAGAWTANGRVYISETVNTQNSALTFNDYVSLGYGYKEEANKNKVVTSQGDRVTFNQHADINPIYGHVDITGGDWIVLQPISIKGDYQGTSNLLTLPAFIQDENYPKQVIPVEIVGEATGRTTVRLVDQSDITKEGMPIVGQNYINGQTSSEDVFVLINENAKPEGLYFKKLSDADTENKTGYDMWQVAKKQRYTVTYTFISGTNGKGLPMEVTDLLPIDSQSYEQGATVTAIQPDESMVEAADGIWQFMGYDMDTTVADGNVAFTGTWVFTPNPSTVNIEITKKLSEEADKIATVDGIEFKISEKQNPTAKEYIKDADGVDRVAVIDKDGIGVFEDLAYDMAVDKTYYIIETKTKEGLQLKQDPIKVVVGKNLTPDETSKKIVVKTDVIVNYAQTETDPGINHPTFQLPLTGGAGTAMLTMGALFSFTAALLIIIWVNSRKS